MKVRPSSKQPKAKKAPLKVVVDREQRMVLEEIARTLTYPYRDVQRARLILWLANGMAQTEVAAAEAGAVKPGNLFSGARPGAIDEESLGINRGSGRGNGVAGRQGGSDDPGEYSTWLTEDEMVWGDDQPNAPGVLGGESTGPDRPEQG